MKLTGMLKQVADLEHSLAMAKESTRSVEFELEQLKVKVASRMNEIYAAAGVPDPSTPLIPHLEQLRFLLHEVLTKCGQSLHSDGCGRQYRGCSPWCLKNRIEKVLGMEDDL